MLAMFSCLPAVFALHCTLLVVSERDCSQLIRQAETLLRQSAVYDVILAQNFQQLVTGSDTAQRVVTGSDSLDRYVAATPSET